MTENYVHRACLGPPRRYTTHANTVQVHTDGNLTACAICKSAADVQLDYLVRIDLNLPQHTAG